MIGKTRYGFCLREARLCGCDDDSDQQCKIPLSDGKPCGDTGLSTDRKKQHNRCVYNKTELTLNREGLFR